MAVIQVQSPGLQTTVQDLGRHGYGPLGVSPSGAADPLSLRIGNRLLGNPESAAAVEMTLMGGAYLFPDGATAALTGSNFDATLDGQPIEMWTAFAIRPGQVLKLPHTRTGARCYLCVHGGVVVPMLLGSASTHLLSGLGGVEGRALRKGDVLTIGAESSRRNGRVDPRFLSALVPGRTLTDTVANLLRVTTGPQAQRFSASSESFYGGLYTVTEEANRTGIRLEGPPIEDPAKGHMITEGVCLGAIQVPAGGQPIILHVEQQTAGGYPKIANIIAADLASLGQLRPRDSIRFSPVTLETAIALLREQEQFLQSEEWILE